MKPIELTQIKNAEQFVLWSGCNQEVDHLAGSPQQRAKYKDGTIKKAVLFIYLYIF